MRIDALAETKRTLTVVMKEAVEELDDLKTRFALEETCKTRL